MWLEMKRDVVTTEKDIFLCAVYIPRQDPFDYNENSIFCLEAEISL